MIPEKFYIKDDSDKKFKRIKLVADVATKLVRIKPNISYERAVRGAVILLYHAHESVTPKD